MGRSKSVPVQRREVDSNESSDDAWLGRRASGSSPQDLLRQELMEEQEERRTTRRQLFEVDDADNSQDVEFNDASEKEDSDDDSQDIIVVPTARPRASPPRRKKARRIKNVSFSESLVTAMLPPEIMLSQNDDEVTVLKVSPRTATTSADDAPTFLLRSFVLPNTIVKFDEVGSKLPPASIVSTSLGVADLWKHYSLPGVESLPNLLACLKQAFLRFEIQTTTILTTTLNVHVTRAALETCHALNLPVSLLNSPHSKQRQKADQMRTVLASFFPGLSNTAPSSSVPDVTARQIYKVVDNVQLQTWLDEKEQATCRRRVFPGLLPTLRPYQQAAVEWMLEREEQAAPSREWELGWVVLHDCDQGGYTFLPDYMAASLKNAPMASLYYNQFTGWLATSYEDARAMSVGDEALVVRGGILAESMGLGKTVEVLACILAHRMPQFGEVHQSVTATTIANDRQLVSPDSTTSDEKLRATNADEMIDLSGDNVGFVGDLAEFGDAEDSSDEESLSRNSRTDPTTVCASNRAAPVTPEKLMDVRHIVREEWADDDELGSCICGKVIGFTDCEGQSIVVCSSCREPMHMECANWPKHDGTNSQCHYKLRQRFTNKAIPCFTCYASSCPSCIASGSNDLNSGATLIITPPAILDQWRHEIAQHTSREGGLNVVVYEGVKALQSTRSTSASRQFLHPSILAKADIVLMTFDSLMSDLCHSDDNRFVAADQDAHLRKRKRYRIVASPLISIRWWRIILDEAQRVESSTASSAKMALKLTGCHRWAVTGTPLGRGKLDDLYGLLLFLRLKPFTIKQIFNRYFQGFGCVNKRIAHLLNSILWRSTKSSYIVSQQLGLLDQIQKKVVLRFSSIERHFYNQQLQEALSVVAELDGDTKKGKKRKAVQLAVTDRLYRLRAACCHPQVGSSGVFHPKRLRRSTDGASNSVCRRVMSMEQILITFIEDARLKCEEAQRLAIMHRNAVAAISRLKVIAKQRDIEIPETDLLLLSKSRDLYLEALKLVKGNATPNLILGDGLVTGSIGFSSRVSHLKNGIGYIAWQFMDRIPSDVSATIDFSETTSKKVTQLRILTVADVPLALRDDASVDFVWQVLHPKECILQVQVDSVGGDFVNVATFFMPLYSGEAAVENWITKAGFMTNKSKIWRIVVSSFHQLADHCPCIPGQPFGVFVGLSIEMYEADISNDPIQRLHALTNAVVSCQSLLALEDDSTRKVTDAQITSLQDEAAIIESLYLGRARSLHSETKRKLQQSTGERIDKEEALYLHSIDRQAQPADCWEDTWWRDFLSAVHIFGSDQQKQAILSKLSEELHIYIEGNSQGFDSRGVPKFPPFNSTHGFMTALDFRIQSIRSGIGGKKGDTKSRAIKSADSHRKDESGTIDGAQLFEYRSTRFKLTPGQHANCMDAVAALSDDPSTAEILENSECSVCKVDWYKTGPKCRHCHLGSELEDLSCDKVTENVLRVLGDIVRSSLGTSILNEIDDRSCVAKRAKSFFDLLEAQKREKIAAYRMWRVHLDLLNDLDELAQVKSSMRLSEEGEDLTKLSEDEKNAVVQAVDIHRRYHDHAAKEAMALGDLRRAQDKLRYLQSLVFGQAEELECPICLNAFDERAVLRCGHSMCKKCLDEFQAHSKGQLITCPKKCSLKTNPQDIMLASNASKVDGSSSTRKVKGSYGTKVTHLLADVLDVRDQGDKGIVFSQWEDMLDIVQSALVANEVGFVRADSRRSIGDSVVRFRDPSVTLLLLDVKHGAEGLTILEATHCFMVEPILNAGLDAQAISRNFRIGQCRRTYVHRYLIEGTIETKIDKIREEHQIDEEALEEALNEGRKSVIGGGGIDGGFSSKSEVMELLSLDD
ncbi:hypothetical protein MPSEU_000308100 [Mayamaea pseudoterrestris]|nr:hypothetical protein MPSEU_000308100 [Mayamaea pseudoterrestris]